MPNTSRSVSFHLERHAHLIAWWDSQENASEVVRRLIEAHLGRDQNGGLDLAELRQIIEAALDQRLVGLTLPSQPANDLQQSPQTDAISAFDHLLE